MYTYIYLYIYMYVYVYYTKLHEGREEDVLGTYIYNIPMYIYVHIYVYVHIYINIYIDIHTFQEGKEDVLGPH
jgi:hypothetical protein